MVDANVAAAACAKPDGFAELGEDQLVAPPLLWSELFSLTHEARFREEITAEQAKLLLDRSEASPLESRQPKQLRRTAWRIADQLGHARTYDAEYVALAQILGCRLLTLDLRLRRGAERLWFVITPAEIVAARKDDESERSTTEHDR